MDSEQHGLTLDERETRFGAQVRACRIASDLDQASLAQRADVSVGTIRNLEAGNGSSLKTLISVLRVLERTDWLEDLTPLISISPLQMLASKRSNPEPRQRVSPRRQVDGLTR